MANTIETKIHTHNELHIWELFNTVGSEVDSPRLHSTEVTEIASRLDHVAGGGDEVGVEYEVCSATYLDPENLDLSRRSILFGLKKFRDGWYVTYARTDVPNHRALTLLQAATI